jgi:hypothetical protein
MSPRPIVLGFLIICLGACEGTDRSRVVLDQQRNEWSDRLESLRARQVDQEARLREVSRVPAADRAAAARMLRLEASVASSKQALFDMRTHIESSARDVEAAAKASTSAGREALDAVRLRMAEHFHAQEQDLAATEAALIAGQPASSPQPQAAPAVSHN